MSDTVKGNVVTFLKLSQIAVLIPLADTQNVKVGRCDPLFLLGIMYPQKVLHRLGDLRRCIKVLLNRFGAGFRVMMYVSCQEVTDFGHVVEIL